MPESQTNVLIPSAAPAPYQPETIIRFLTFLDKHDSHFTVSFLNQFGKGVIPSYGIKIGTPHDIIEWCDHLSSQAATLHVTLNRTKNGRKREHVESCRVLCLDLDRTISPKGVYGELRRIVTNYGADMIVASSPAKFHIYWRISDTVTIAQWSKYQLALAQHFTGDHRLSQPNHTIRVPGVQRTTKDGSLFTPRIVWQSRKLVGPLDDATVIEWFPWIESEYQNGLARIAEERTEFKRELTRLRTAIKKKVRLEGGKIEAEGRNVSLYMEVNEKAVEMREWGEAECKAYAIEVNGVFATPLDGEEVSKTAKSAWEHAVTYRERKKEKAEEKGMQMRELLMTTDPKQPSDAKQTEHAEENHESNGAARSTAKLLYPYDYTTPNLTLFRFGERGALERMFQRFGRELVSLNGKDIYVCSIKNRLWESQRPTPRSLNRMAVNVVDDMLTDPTFVSHCSKHGDPDPVKMQKEATRLSNRKFWQGLVSDVLTLGPTEDRVQVVKGEKFDFDPYIFYVQNGVLNLCSGTLRAALVEDMLTKQAQIEYRKDAQCPKWLKFLREVFDENDAPEELIAFFQEYFWYSLTGLTTEQKIFIHTGEGSNAKSKILECLSRLTDEYGTTIGPSVLSKTKRGFAKEIERVAVKFREKRCVIADDTDTKTQWNEGMVKKLMGPKHESKALYNEEFTLPNRAKFHIGCQDVPTPESENFGLLRRLCIIEYKRTFEPDPAKDRELTAEQEEEISGILNWVLDGGKRVMARGGRIQYPEELRVSIQEYKMEYFLYEPLVEEMFESVPRGTSERESKENHHFVPDLVREVNRRAMLQGNPSNDMTATHLGRLIKKIFGEKPERTSNKHERKTYYVLKLKSQLIKDLI